MNGVVRMRLRYDRGDAGWLAPRELSDFYSGLIGG